MTSEFTIIQIQIATFHCPQSHTCHYETIALHTNKLTDLLTSNFISEA